MELASQTGAFVAGLVLSWSLAAPPGPANAMMAHEAAARSWAAGVRTGMGAVSGDVLMFLLMWLGVLRLVGGRPGALALLAVVGCALMLYFARGAWVAARRHGHVEDRVGGFAKNLMTVVTSPFNWGWWLTMGTTLFANLGWPVMLGFFVGLTLWVGAWCGLARLGARRFERFAEWIAYASAAVLVVFAGLAGWYAVQAFVG